MPVFTFANTKGGAGKTTAVMILACELVRRNYPVTIIDADPRGWISRWYDMSDLPAERLDVIYDVTEDTIEAIVAEARQRDGIVIIDLPSIHDALLAKSVGLADHVFIPVQGCAMDAAGGADILDLLHELELGCGIHIPHSVVLNRVNAAVTTRALQAARSFLIDRHVPVMETPLTERAAYRDIFDRGGLLHDLDPAQVSNLAKALENGGRFVDEILTLAAIPSRSATSERMPQQHAA
ncbi:ParA family protein [Allorhizobium sp. BGMRC 0089]|uniref:ParA family protein n=1 Tax=Allorhizobium sonneratiae TaxID=2934936 RepID=UPI002034A741|nr:ParA family protein [Allorhizobium sonneratiae]MCM2293728.1 ParA family protein [Allorhizobium sonneratiae]